MSEQRKENSVLFSLRELRGIEDERIQEEHDAAKQAEEERIRARMEVERLEREELDRQRLQRENEERIRREDAERIARDERLRAESIERRTRVEAQAALERERLAKELELRTVEAHKKRPTALIVMAVCLLVVIVGLGKFLYDQSQKNDHNERVARERAEKIRSGIDATLQKIDELDTEREQRFQALLAADTAEDKAAAKQELERTEAKLHAQKEALKRLREQTQERAQREENKKVKPKCKPNDPLCGM